MLKISKFWKFSEIQKVHDLKKLWTQNKILNLKITHDSKNITNLNKPCEFGKFSCMWKFYKFGKVHIFGKTIMSSKMLVNT